MPLSLPPSARQPDAGPARSPAWRWPVILRLAGLGMALSLAIAGHWGAGIVLPAAGFTLLGLVLVWLVPGRRHRLGQTLAWHRRERSWN